MTFKHSKKWYFWASWIAWAVGALCCVLPPFIATIQNFPMMVTKNTDSTISIFFVLGIMIALTVVLQKVVKAFKDNAMLSVAVVLGALCVIFTCGYNMEKSTLAGLAWIAGAGAGGVLVGLACFKIHAIWHDLYKNCGEVYVNGAHRN